MGTVCLLGGLVWPLGQGARLGFMRPNHWSLLLILGLALSACERKTPASPTSPSAPAAPTIVVAPPISAPPPVQPRLSPEGVVYLTKRISVTTESSVVGVPEGTRIVVLSRDSGRITGHIDGLVVEVAEADTSRDLDRISAILTKRAQAEAVAEQADPLKAAGIEVPEVKPLTLEEKKANRLAAWRKIQELQTNIEAAQKQLAELKSEKIELIRKSLPTKKGKVKEKPKAPEQDITPAIQGKIDELRMDLEKMQKDLAEARRAVGLGAE